jgi:hypothetical protein
VAGIPARLVRMRFNTEHERVLHEAMVSAPASRGKYTCPR